MTAVAGTNGDPGRVRRLPRRFWIGLVVVLLVVVLAAQNSVVRFPNLLSYRLVGPRTIALTVAVAPCSWTRVTDVAESSAEVRIKVETLPCPLPGPSTAELALREMPVSFASDLGARVVEDAEGTPVPRRP